VDLAPLNRRLRVGLITNPGSGRNRSGLSRVRRLCADIPALGYQEAGDPDEISAALAELSRFGPDVLAVNGGDGTVQAVLTALFRDRPFEQTPLLALLPGGTTNMSAGDVGLRGRMPGALQRLLKLTDLGSPPPKVERRPILKVEAIPEGHPRYGMFFGAGAIIKGIEYCHAKVHTKGFRDGIAPGICTLRLLLAMARKDRSYAAPTPMTVTTATANEPSRACFGQQDYYLVLASPLERLFLGLRPYWGRRQGAFYFSALRADPLHALRALPPLFWGRAGPLATPENGYYSEKIDELELDMDGPFTLDGEIYHAYRDSGPVRVTVGGWASFLRI
jgi:hypothetical protein